MRSMALDDHEHLWERIPRSWPPRFRCTDKRCNAVGRVQRTDDASQARPRIIGWEPEELRNGAYMQEVTDGNKNT